MYNTDAFADVYMSFQVSDYILYTMKAKQNVLTSHNPYAFRFSYKSAYLCKYLTRGIIL